MLLRPDLSNLMNWKYTYYILDGRSINYYHLIYQINSHVDISLLCERENCQVTNSLKLIRIIINLGLEKLELIFFTPSFFNQKVYVELAA